ncbi:hypothetical protein Abor_007_101 [Acetobacter orientalis]|uniref:Uncharacterized protein n=1 Tax=Acetobacter orientalis TaxID=146474 RepID=A0A0D6NIC9_9PROT|nr:hypothetical protein Abor_007_101 [Acetobacter orientalis]
MAQSTGVQEVLVNCGQFVGELNVKVFNYLWIFSHKFGLSFMGWGLRKYCEGIYCNQNPDAIQKMMKYQGSKIINSYYQLALWPIRGQS